MQDECRVGIELFLKSRLRIFPLQPRCDTVESDVSSGFLQNTCVFQGDPLPAALVELVRNSPIASIEDLQLLLLTDSVGKDQPVLTSPSKTRTNRTQSSVHILFEP